MQRAAGRVAPELALAFRRGVRTPASGALMIMGSFDAQRNAAFSVERAINANVTPGATTLDVRAER